MVRVFAPTSVIWPSASCCMTTRVASQAKRRDVSAGTCVPSSRTDWPGASGSANTGASTWTTTWYRSPGCAGIDPMVERRFGDESQRVRLLLRHGRRFLGNVIPGRSCGNVIAVLRVGALIQRLAGRSQRLHEHGADLRCQPSADDHHTVFVSIHMERPAPVAPSALPSFGDAVHPAPATDDALDVLGGSGAADREQALLGRGSGHAA